MENTNITWKELEARGGIAAVLAEANRHGWNAWIVIASDALLAGARREQLDVLFDWAMEAHPEATANYLRGLWEAV